MTTQIRSLSHRRRIRGSFLDTVLSTGPIAYWPLDESAGTTARCLVNSAQNGTYTGVTLANDSAGPFGTPAPFFDGANDYVNVKTATLEALWNAGGAEWSIMTWWRAANVGVWTDAAYRYVFMGIDTANDYALIGRTNVNNQFRVVWRANATTQTDLQNGLTTTDWQSYIVTRSEAAGEVKYYRNGALLATDGPAIGAWASAGGWTNILIGAETTVPAQVWHGWIAHTALWNRALTPGNIATLANP